MTSLTVPPWAFLTRFRSARSVLGHLEAAVGADLDVEDGVGGGHPGGDHLRGGADAVEDLARAAQRRAEAAVDLLRAGQPLLPGFGQQLDVGRLGAGEPGRRLLGRAGRLGVEVEEDGRDVDAGDAVDEGVVALADDREAVAGQALDQPQLPERLRAVELLGEDPRRQVAQLLVGTGRRQRGLADVVVEVEVGVVDPDRPPLGEGDEAQFLAESRHQVQARGDVIAEFLVARRLAAEDRGRGDVHMGAGALQVEERGVQAGEAFGLRHKFIFAHGSRAR